MPAKDRIVFDCTNQLKSWRLEFIAKYEALPALWDSSCMDYTNREKRRQALAQLLPIMRKVNPSADYAEVRKQLNALRSNYRKDCRRMAALPGYTPNRKTFAALSFLSKNGKTSGSDLSNNRFKDDIDETAYFSSIKIEEPEVTAEVETAATELIQEQALELNSNTQASSNMALSQQNDTRNNLEAKCALLNMLQLEENSSASSAKKRERPFITIRKDITQNATRPTNVNYACSPKTTVLTSMKHQAPITFSKASTERQELHTSVAHNMQMDAQAIVWSNKLKLLPADQRLYVEKAINDIFYEAELNNMKH